MTIMTTFDKLCYVLVNNLRLLLVRRCSCPIHNVHRKPDDDDDNSDDVDDNYDDNDDQDINDDDDGLALLLSHSQCASQT